MEDVWAKKAELEGKGVHFYTDVDVVDEGPLAGWRWVYFADPDGLALELVQIDYYPEEERKQAIAEYLAGRPPARSWSARLEPGVGSPLPVERLAVRVGHELELHAPRGEEVDPALALAGPAAGGGFAEDREAQGVQVRDGGVEILDVERDVVPADVAVARRHWFWSAASYSNTSKMAWPPSR